MPPPPIPLDAPSRGLLFLPRQTETAAESAPAAVAPAAVDARSRASNNSGRDGTGAASIRSLPLRMAARRSCLSAHHDPSFVAPRDFGIVDLRGLSRT